MGLGELLDQIRMYYLERYRDAMAGCISDADCRMVIEAPFLDANGKPVLEGRLNLPLRGDIFFLKQDQATKSIQIDTENMLGFSPLRFQWKQGLSVHLMPFKWNWLPLTASPARGVHELAPIKDWFERWFEEREIRTDEFFGVVHFLSDPEVTDLGLQFYIDLGSAPVEAFETLLDSCVEIGATSVSIGTGLKAN